MRFVRDILARMFHEGMEKEKTLIDTEKLSVLLREVMGSNEYHRKIKSKANGIINDVDDEEKYLSSRFSEIWKLLDKNNS